MDSNSRKSEVMTNKFSSSCFNTPKLTAFKKNTTKLCLSLDLNSDYCSNLDYLKFPAAVQVAFIVLLPTVYPEFLLQLS